jgi:hypothetical protein
MFSAQDLLRTVIVAVFLVLAAASLVTKSPSMSAATPAATTKSTAPARGYYLRHRQRRWQPGAKCLRSGLSHG